MTKVILQVQGKEAIEVDSEVRGISIKDGVFKVVVPMHDFWTYTEDFKLIGAEASSNIGGEQFTVQFPNETLRARFQDWLIETITKAKEGYRTMYP